MFPPYFVLGAAFSGFAVVSMIAIVLRARLPASRTSSPRATSTSWPSSLLATGLMTAYGYVAEVFAALLLGRDRTRCATLRDRLSGDYAWSYWGAVVLNFVPLAALWLRRVRSTARRSCSSIGLSVAVGMWFERYMLLVTALYRDYLPSSWGIYHAERLGMDASMPALIGLFLVPLPAVRALPAGDLGLRGQGGAVRGSRGARRPVDAPVRHRRDRTRLPAIIGERRSALSERPRSAEFDEPEGLLQAAGRARAQGYRHLDAFTPFPVEGLAEAIGFEDGGCPLVTSSAASSARPSATACRSG